MGDKRDFLITARKEQDLTQKELAEKVNISVVYLRKIEHGDRNLSVKVAKRIAKELNIKWTEFYV